MFLVYYEGRFIDTVEGTAKLLFLLLRGFEL